MQRTGYDSNLAALQAGAGLPGHVLDVVVLTADPGVLATLRSASGPEHAIWHAQSADAAVDLLVGGRCSILIADIARLRDDAAALLANLHVQFPELVLMATGRREEEGAVAALVSDGRIYRFLHKPISPARASLFITAATRRYNELRSVEPIALTTVRTIAARPRSTWIIIVAALALFTIALWFVPSGDDSASSALPQSPVSQVSPEMQAADNLAHAQIAYATGRLTEPRGNNALEYFRAVLAADPANVEARTGVERVISALEAKVVEALRARDAAKGATALNALRRAQPDHPRLDQLYAELVALARSVNVQPPSAARQPSVRVSRPAAAPTPLTEDTRDAPRSGVTGADASETQPGTTVASEAVQPESPSAAEIEEVTRLREQGALLEPEDANAYAAFVTLQTRYPEAEALRTQQQRLVFALLESARTELAAENIDSAATLVERAETLLPGMNATRDLRNEIDAARQRRE